MPKAEKGSLKDIAKRSKAKGLQKLKFYCQMCEKQCRDANGFKCHLTSESHLRNMKLFAENAGGIVDTNSKAFEKVYLETLRRRHGTKQVNANNVYQEVIQDKFHIHMNATKWATLSDFCQYLGRTGKCVVEETERGWYVAFIQRDASILARKERQQQREAAERVAEERFSHQMEMQRREAAKALDRVGGTVHVAATKLQRNGDSEGQQNISLSLKGSKKMSKLDSQTKNSTKTKPSSVFGLGDDDEDDEGDDDDEEEEEAMARKRALQELDRLKEQTMNKPQSARPSKRPRTDTNDEPSSSTKTTKASSLKDVRKEHWVRRDILVRIVSKKLAKGQYFKRKAVVTKVMEDKFTAEVEVFDSGPDANDGGDVLRLDQDDLETVVPKEGKTVRILNGRGRGEKAKLVSVKKAKYLATLELLSDGTILKKVDFADFSKMAN